MPTSPRRHRGDLTIFTWCRHFDHTEISSVTVRNLYAILFPHEFAKLGTSVSQATLWNFVATILLVKLSKLMKNSASVKHWKLGFRDGVHGNNPHSIQNSFQYGPEGRLSGACHVTVKYPDSFYHDTIATAFKKKNSVNFRFSFLSLTFSPCLFNLLVLIFLSTLCIFCHSHIHATFDHHQFSAFRIKFRI